MDVEQVQTSVKLKCKYRLGFFFWVYCKNDQTIMVRLIFWILGGSEKKIIETRGKSFLIGILVMKTWKNG